MYLTRYLGLSVLTSLIAFLLMPCLLYNFWSILRVIFTWGKVSWNIPALCSRVRPTCFFRVVCDVKYSVCSSVITPKYFRLVMFFAWILLLGCLGKVSSLILLLTHYRHNFLTVVELKPTTFPTDTYDAYALCWGVGLRVLYLASKINLSRWIGGRFSFLRLTIELLSNNYKLQGYQAVSRYNLALDFGKKMN